MLYSKHNMVMLCIGGIIGFYDIMFYSQTKGFLLGAGRLYASVMPGSK